MSDAGWALIIATLITQLGTLTVVVLQHRWNRGKRDDAQRAHSLVLHHFGAVSANEAEVD